MRWKEKTPAATPERGDKRTIYKFLLLPRTIGGETRWLETCGIRQECVMVPQAFDGLRWDAFVWRDKAWAEKEIDPDPRQVISPRAKVGGENQKPVGSRPTPPPAPPDPLRVQT